MNDNFHTVHRINFDEPIVEMVARLEREHQDFRSKPETSLSMLVYNRDGSIRILDELGEKIIQHAVEEEARLMRIIMEKARSDSERSIHVMQEHNHVVTFIKNTLPQLRLVPEDKAREQITQFADALKEHFSEEEVIVFPLVRKIAT